jgi:hypothetical protein
LIGLGVNGESGSSKSECPASETVTGAGFFLVSLLPIAAGDSMATGTVSLK